MMHSQRRIKAIVVVAIVVLVAFLFFSGHGSDEAFFDRTVAALHAKHESGQARMGTAAVQDRKLQEAAAQIKEEVVADAEERRKKEKDGHVHGGLHGGGLNDKDGVRIEYKDANQKVMGGVDEDKPTAVDDKEKKPHSVGGTKGKWTTGEEVAEEAKPEKTEEEHEVDAELTSILKRSPIIIFSKSYCPYSKKAKSIFAKYSITPAPFIVELDQTDLGPQLQDKLLDTTGRRTVPNVLISGKSIGGGDDVEALDRDGKLVETIKAMGGKRIMEAKLID